MLRSKLKEKKLTLNILSDLSDLSEDTLRSIIYGKSQDIKLSTIIKIADVFNCSIDELVNHNTHSPQTRKIITQLQRLPERSIQFIQIIVTLEEKRLLLHSTKGQLIIPIIIPKCSIKDGMFYESGHINYLDISEYPAPLRKAAAFGLFIQSSFYEPIFFPNDILLFSLNKQPQFNDIILFITDYGQLFIRKYTNLGFEPLNGFGDIIYNKESAKYKKLGIYIKTAHEFDIEQYR